MLLLDEIAGGLTEAEVAELIDKVREIHAGGITIVWIEHIVHALIAVVGRIMAMSFGRKIAEGEPREVMASAAVREVYLGVDGGLTGALWRSSPSTPATATSRRCSGCRSTSSEGETVAIIGANGAGKSDTAAGRHGPGADRARHDPLRGR